MTTRKVGKRAMKFETARANPVFGVKFSLPLPSVLLMVADIRGRSLIDADHLLGSQDTLCLRVRKTQVKKPNKSSQIPYTMKGLMMKQLDFSGTNIN